MMIDGGDPDSEGIIGPDDPMRFSGQNRAERSSEILWESDDVQIVTPQIQAVHPGEGTQMEVLPLSDTTGDWRTDSTANILREGYYSLAVARTLVQSGSTEEYWANLHWNSTPNFVGGANVYGKNPASEEGWAKPVSLDEKGFAAPGNADFNARMQRFSDLYFPQWEQRAGEMTIFQNGVREVKRDSEEFLNDAQKYKEKKFPYEETLLWENDKFSLVAVDRPHLNGFHLVIHPRPDYWQDKGKFTKPWQQELSYAKDDPEHERGFLESLAVLKVVQGILAADSGLGFSNPEIHYSGNWADDLQTTNKGGKIDIAKAVKLAQEGSISETKEYKDSLKNVATAMHGHLYATRSQDQHVHLPSRPLGEVPKEWEGINPMADSEVARIRALIEENLGAQLEALEGYNLGKENE